MQRISPKYQRFSWVISRSSRAEVFFTWGILEYFSKLTGNPLLILEPHNRFAVFQSATLFKKKRLQHRRFYMNFAGFSITPPSDCLVFHYFKSGFSLCIAFCRILQWSITNEDIRGHICHTISKRIRMKIDSMKTWF